MTPCGSFAWNQEKGDWDYVRVGENTGLVRCTMEQFQQIPLESSQCFPATPVYLKFSDPSQNILIGLEYTLPLVGRQFYILKELLECAKKEAQNLLADNPDQKPMGTSPSPLPTERPPT